MRGALASLLILIGAVLTFPASLAVWEQRVLTDREAFVDLGQEILEDPAVQERVAERVQEETLAVAAANGYTFPDNAAGSFGRNQTEALSRAVVMELPRSPIGERALITAHEALLAVIDNDRETLTTEDDEVRVNLRPVVEQVLDNFQALIPNFPELVLPPGTGELVIVQEEDVALAFDAARWFDGAAWYIAAVPVLCFVAAIAVASNRQIALFLIGLSLIVTAGLRVFFYEGWLRQLITDNVVDDPALRPAARGVYDSIAASLVSQDMLVLAAGVFIVVASVVWWAVKRTGNF